MKGKIWLILLFSGISIFAKAQVPYHVAFDITTGDTAAHARVLRWAKGITESDPAARVVIVMYGRSVDMVVNDKSSVKSEVQRLANGKQVSFVACEHALQVFNIDKSRLITGVTTAPDGVYELVKKQAEGFGYIKITN
jgi:uncharacterized protein